jgi:hypothetical protein
MIIAASSEAVNRVGNRGGDAPPTGVVGDCGRGASVMGLLLLWVVSGVATFDLRDGISAFILFKAGVCYYNNCK